MGSYPQSAAGGEKMAEKGQESNFQITKGRENPKQIIDVEDKIVYANVEPTEGRWAGANLIRLATFPNCGVCAGDNHISWVELETTIKDKKVVSVTAYIQLHCNNGDCEWSVEVPADF